MRFARFVGMLLGVMVLAGAASTGANPLRAAPFALRTAPTISSFSPASGAAGTPIIITGSDLTNASEVQFNGTRASGFSIDSDTQMTATVPDGATSGPIGGVTPDDAA